MTTKQILTRIALGIGIAAVTFSVSYFILFISSGFYAPDYCLLSEVGSDGIEKCLGLASRLPQLVQWMLLALAIAWSVYLGYRESGANE